MVAQSGFKAYIPITILFTVNTLNFMDRYTVAGVLNDIQNYYNIDDAQGGLIQTVFMAFYIVFSPACGFLGDRYNRKWLMVVGISLWVSIVLASTFVPSNMFWLFLILRGLVGVGEATFVLNSPSLIGDMYCGTVRSKMLMFFYLASPIGSGLGFIVGSSSDGLFGGWQWGLRVSCFLGLIGLALIIFFIHEPERGAAEREIGQITVTIENTNYLMDLWQLAKNPTYMLSSFGYTTLAFAVGTLSWWLPTAIEHKEAWKQGLNSTDLLSDDDKSKINGVIGLVTLVAGILGVVMGTIISGWMYKGVGPFRFIQTKRSDAIISMIGSILGIPTLIIGIWAIKDYIVLTYIMIFLCTTFLSMNWATGVDMLLSVVIPPRRGTANAFQILISHVFGDGSGPYLIGKLSDAIRGSKTTPYAHFHSLQISFYIAAIVLVIGAVLFAISALTIIRDQRIFEEEMGAIRLRQKSSRSSSTSIENDKKKLEETESENSDDYLRL